MSEGRQVDPEMPTRVPSAGLLAVAAGGLLATRLGGEFIPRLD